MGRKRKLEGGETVSLRFPRKLILAIEKAARLRDVRRSDVVRDIVQEGIAGYLRESLKAWLPATQERLQQAEAVLQSDPELWNHYQRSRGKRVVRFPAGEIEQHRRFLAAHNAHKDLKLLRENIKDPMAAIEREMFFESWGKAPPSTGEP